MFQPRIRMDCSVVIQAFASLSKGKGRIAGPDLHHWIGALVGWTGRSNYEELPCFCKKVFLRIRTLWLDISSCAKSGKGKSKGGPGVQLSNMKKAYRFRQLSSRPLSHCWQVMTQASNALEAKAVISRNFNICASFLSSLRFEHGHHDALKCRDSIKVEPQISEGLMEAQLTKVFARDLQFHMYEIMSITSHHTVVWSHASTMLMYTYIPFSKWSISGITAQHFTMPRFAWSQELNKTLSWSFIFFQEISQVLGIAQTQLGAARHFIDQSSTSGSTLDGRWPAT